MRWLNELDHPGACEICGQEADAPWIYENEKPVCRICVEQMDDSEFTSWIEGRSVDCQRILAESVLARLAS